MSHLQTGRLYQLSASGRICSRAGTSQEDEEALGLVRCLGRLINICKVEEEIVIAVCGGAKWS